MSSLFCPWDTLPVDLHAKIFQHVGAIPNLIDLRLVSRNFNLIITGRKYQCCGCNMILFESRSNPDDEIPRLAWEPNQNRLILWYNCKQISEDKQEQIKHALSFVKSIDVGQGFLVDVHRSSAVLQLVYKGKWPVGNDFAKLPPIVRKHCRPSQYPVSSDLAFTNPNRLTEISGYPSPLPFVNNSETKYWRDGAVIVPCLAMPGNDYIIDRGFDINEHGWMAILMEQELCVMRPVERTHRFSRVAAIPASGFGGGKHRVRVRYQGNTVLVFAHYTITRYVVDRETNTITQNGLFEDDYAKQQKFVDIDMQGKFIVAGWRKWAGFYLKDDFEWFHAVSISSVLTPPKSISLRNNYLHVSNGSSIFAFHPASRDPTVLWVIGNLPKEESQDAPFCVSKTYGVFCAVHGEIVQSYYDAPAAQSVFGYDASIGDGVPCPTPAPSDYDARKHLVDEKLRMQPNNFSPFCGAEHIEYDEAYGRHGRLLCYDKARKVMTMALNRGEFEILIDMFAGVFRHFAPVEEVWARKSLHDFDCRKCFAVGDEIQVKEFSGWKDGTVERVDEGEDLKLRIAVLCESKSLIKPLENCRSRNLVDKLSETQKSEIEAVLLEYMQDYGESVTRFVLEESIGLEVTGLRDTFTVRFRTPSSQVS